MVKMLGWVGLGIVFVLFISCAFFLMANNGEAEDITFKQATGMACGMVGGLGIIGGIICGLLYMIGVFD